MRCTAAASLSIRRTRSADTVSRSSARCRASQVARTPAVVRPSAAASSNSSVVCRRSVSSRAPSVRPSTRAASRPSAPASSRTADGPRWRSTSDHPRRVSESSAVTASPPRSRSSAERPRNGVRAAARTRAERCGWAIASSRVSQDRPAGVPRTEPDPTRTVATPRRSSAAATTDSFDRTSARTATWRGCSGRPSNVAPEARSRATSSARSSATTSRSRPIGSPSSRGRRATRGRRPAAGTGPAAARRRGGSPAGPR